MNSKIHVRAFLLPRRSTAVAGIQKEVHCILNISKNFEFIYRNYVFVNISDLTVLFSVYTIVVSFYYQI